MRRLRDENNYWITEDEAGHLFLMHRVDRPDLGCFSEFCVGEAITRRDGYIEVRIAFVSDRLDKSGQILVGITDSPSMACEVLWEQRNVMHWGTYQ